MRRPGGDVACQPELQRPASGGCGAAVDPSDWRTGPGSRNGQRRRAGMPDACRHCRDSEWPRRQRRHGGTQAARSEARRKQARPGVRHPPGSSRGAGGGPPAGQKLHRAAGTRAIMMIIRRVMIT